MRRENPPKTDLFLSLLLTVLLSGCASRQMVASLGSGVFSNEPKPALPPACLALLATNPNGDSLVQAVAVGPPGKSCIDSSQYPQNQTKRDGEWFVFFDSATRVTIRYRNLAAQGACLRLVQVQENFGGSFTTDELLAVESGKQLVPSGHPRAVVVVLKRFPSTEVAEATDFLRKTARWRTCR